MLNNVEYNRKKQYNIIIMNYAHSIKGSYHTSVSYDPTM